MSPALAGLRKATRPLHEKTEAAVAADRLLAGDFSTRDFDLLLRKNYYLYASFESELLRTAGEVSPALRDSLPVLLPVLERVCLNREISIDAFEGWPRANLLPTTRNGVYGMAYVLLGSHLGGKTIYRSLREQPRLVANGGLDFYAAVAGLPARNWPRFLAQLDAELRTPAAIAEATDTAVALFDFFHRVYAFEPNAR